MSKMQNYIKEILEKDRTSPEGGDDITVDANEFGKALMKRRMECSYCNNEELIIFLKETPVGVDYHHLCPKCNASWIYKYNDDLGTITISNIDIKMFFESMHGLAM
jgi:hypothetical protein